MTIVKTGGLAAICAGAAMLVAAPMASAGNAGVNIIYPPKLASDFDKPGEPVATARTKVKVKVKVYVRPDAHRYLRDRHRFYVNRALFQRYVSDRTKYGSPLYPF